MARKQRTGEDSQANEDASNSIVVDLIVDNETTLNSLESRYLEIRVTKNEVNDDIVCDICLHDNDDEGNEIVICELCLAAAH